jgi:hypothetical protein
VFSALELSGQNGAWLRPVPAKPLPGYCAIVGGFGWPVKDPSLPANGIVPMMIRREVWLASRVPELLAQPFASISALFQTAYGPRTVTSGPHLAAGSLRDEPLMAPRALPAQESSQPTALPPADVEPEENPQPRWLTNPEVLGFFCSDRDPDEL